MRTRPDVVREIVAGDQRFSVDEQGFMVEPDAWNETIAKELARIADVRLTERHWAVFNFMRAFLAEHGVAADARFVFRFLEDAYPRPDKSGREHFFELFPYGYVGQACKIAGMRQPRAWSTG
ncbi:MAG: TusE/DsrC/DsvC family sulfur relay protein [Hyphomicrobiaceae bacterium]|nr:TusE/DsrC/DsvC family sulfur relay protein [Hyphomicrobiaceae bacterium]